MESPGIVVVIPAYNEERNLARVLAAACAAGHDVLVVDDGSSDATPKLARQSPAEVIVHPENRGKGAAIRTAIRHALERGYEAALFMDADGQHLPAEIPLFANRFQETGADIVLGTRMNDNAEMPWVRKVSNTFSSGVISLLAGTRVTDSQSGYRLLSARLLRKLKDRGGEGFDFESEMLIDAVRSGMTYAEVPITCVYGDETSYYHPVRDSIQFFALVARKAVDVVFGRVGK